MALDMLTVTLWVDMAAAICVCPLFPVLDFSDQVWARCGKRREELLVLDDLFRKRKSYANGKHPKRLLRKGVILGASTLANPSPPQGLNPGPPPSAEDPREAPSA
eukprot:1152384-Pelagomonas_calceolata.AAC.1